MTSPPALVPVGAAFTFLPAIVTQLKVDLKAKDCPVDAEKLAARFEPDVDMFTAMQGLEAAGYRIPQKTLMSVTNERAVELLSEVEEDLHSTRRDLEALAPQATVLVDTLESLSELARDALKAEGGGDPDALAGALRTLARAAQSARESFPTGGRPPTAVVSKRWLIRQLAVHFEALGGQATTTRDGKFHAVAHVLLDAVPGLEGGWSYDDIRKVLKVGE